MACIRVENKKITTRDIGICGGKNLLEIWTANCQQWGYLRCIMKVANSNINPNQHSTPNFMFFCHFEVSSGRLEDEIHILAPILLLMSI